MKIALREAWVYSRDPRRLEREEAESSSPLILRCWDGRLPSNAPYRDLQMNQDPPADRVVWRGRRVSKFSEVGVVRSEVEVEAERGEARRDEVRGRAKPLYSNAIIDVSTGCSESAQNDAKT